MFCPNCGNQIPDGSICPRCNPVPQAVPPPQFQQAAPPPQYQQIPPQGLSGAVPPPPPPPPSALPSGGYKVNNVLNNANFKLLESVGCFSVYEHQKDLSTSADLAIVSYFMQEMNVQKRQVLAQLNGNTIKMQAGALQWMCGNVESETGLGSGAKAIGGFLKGMVKGMVTGESTVKPLYSGYGFVMLEPTYKYILVEDISKWGPAGIVLQDGLFLACDATLQEQVVSRKTLSSLAAGEGLFNLCLSGNGVAVFESPVPREELIEIELNNSVLKIDGNMAIAWSNTLELTVERSSKSLIGSMVNKEGLLNVYRGTGKVWMTPTVAGTLMEGGEPPAESASSGGSANKSVIGGVLDILSD